MTLASFVVDHLALDRAAVAGLRLLPAEKAHDAAMMLLRAAPAPGAVPTPTLERTIAGLRFANPLGIAAGFDKNGRVYQRALAWGFGSIEVGTVTPRPQTGNPKPRLFRLKADQAVINRMGFNNAGHAALARQLEGRDRAAGVVGVNIGCNKETADPALDYVAGVATFADLADYLTVNVSSPNTPGLRAYQHGERLADLLDRVLAERARRRAVPILLKLAPDLDDDELEAILALVRDRPVNGLIYANTSLARPTGLRSAAAGEAGGLSGRPLRAHATARLAVIRSGLRADQALVGVGGVGGAADVRAMLAAGADLVQLYTALVYTGLGLGRRLLRELQHP